VLVGQSEQVGVCYSVVRVSGGAERAGAGPRVRTKRLTRRRSTTLGRVLPWRAPPPWRRSSHGRRSASLALTRAACTGRSVSALTVCADVLLRLLLHLLLQVWALRPLLSLSRDCTQCVADALDELGRAPKLQVDCATTTATTATVAAAAAAVAVAAATATTATAAATATTATPATTACIYYYYTSQTSPPLRAPRPHCTARAAALHA
jgi:hypothetical protein